MEFNFKRVLAPIKSVRLHQEDADLVKQIAEEEGDV